jgi:hypothetical protein
MPGAQAPARSKARLAIAAAVLLLAALVAAVVLRQRSSSRQATSKAQAPCSVLCERFPTVPEQDCLRTCERVRAERPTLDFSAAYGQCAFNCMMAASQVFPTRDAGGSDDAQGVDVEGVRRAIAACADRCPELRARPMTQPDGAAGDHS